MVTYLKRVELRPIVRPSKIDPWRAGRDAGEKFTARQLREMEARHIDPDTVAVLEVHSPARMDEWYWPAGSPAPIFVFECPIIGERTSRTGEKRIKVISPSGMNKLVWPDGSIKRSVKRGWRR